MRKYCAFLLAVATAALVFNGCSDDESDGTAPSESKCEKLCSRAGTIDCASSTCVADCEKDLTKCNAEYEASIACAADASAVGCVNGKITVDECDTEQGKLTECLLGGGAGGSGGSGTGGSGVGGSGGGSGSDCGAVCAKSKAAGCEPANCVAECEKPLEPCDAEYDAAIACGADKGTITCVDGKPDTAGCDAEETALFACLQGGGDSCYANHGDCDPLGAETCDANMGLGCYLANDNTFACFPAGGAQPGVECVGADDCATNLICAEATPGGATKCLNWCCDQTDCTAGTTCTPYTTVGTIEVKLCAEG